MLTTTLKRLFRLSAGFGRDGRGATAIEYALIAALIGMAIIAAVTQIGTSLMSVFDAIAGAFPH